MNQISSLAIILAAGKGTRMKSELPKVMHKLAGATLLAHVMKAATTGGLGPVAVVVGPGMEGVGAAVGALDPKAQSFVQAKQLGTADAVKAAREALENFKGDVLVLYGDPPLLTAETLNRVRAELKAGADLVVIGFEAADPTGYGRLLLREGGRLPGVPRGKRGGQ